MERCGQSTKVSMTSFSAIRLGINQHMNLPRNASVAAIRQNVSRPASEDYPSRRHPEPSIGAPLFWAILSALCPQLNVLVLFPLQMLPEAIRYGHSPKKCSVLRNSTDLVASAPCRRCAASGDEAGPANQQQKARKP